MHEAEERTVLEVEGALREGGVEGEVGFVRRVGW